MYIFRLRLLRDSGVLKKLRKKNWPKTKLDQPRPWTSVKFSGVLPILLLLSAVYIFATLLLILEKNLPKWLCFVKKMIKKCLPRYSNN